MLLHYGWFKVGLRYLKLYSNVSGIDNNYVATYSMVSILNQGGGGVIWVPPSVVMAGAIANNDSIGQEWF